MKMMGVNLHMPFWKKVLDTDIDTELHGFKQKADQYDATQETDGYSYNTIPGVDDHAVEVAEKLKLDGLDVDFVVVLPRPNQLMIDYDTPDLPDRFQDALDMLTQAFCDIEPGTVLRAERGTADLSRC